MLKHIVFDCSDTLLHFYVLDELTKVVNDPSHAIEIKTRIHQSHAWHLYDKGMISEEGLRHEILPLFQDGEQAFAAWYLEHWLNCYSPIPGMCELVKELHQKGLHLYIISDFPPRFHELKARFPEIFRYFQGFSVSCECQLTKRDKGLFKHFLQHFNLTANECIFVDDVPCLVENARSLGFHAIHFENAALLREQLSKLKIL